MRDTGKEETSCMKHRRPKPRVDAYIRPSEVVWPHGMILGYPLGNHSRPLNVRDQVQHRKHDRGRLLHSRVSKKWPLPIILHDGLLLFDGVIGEEPHALVLAFVGTRPSGEAEEKGDLALAFEVIQANWNATLKEFGSVSR